MLLSFINMKSIRTKLTLQFLAVLSLPVLYLLATFILPDTEFFTSALFKAISLSVATTLSVLLSLLFAGKHASNVRKINEGITALSDGSLPEKITITSNDELAAGAIAINNLIDRMDTAATFATKIGNGELDIQYDQEFSNDVLAKSLQSMHVQLKGTADADRKRNWVTTGLADFGNIIRKTDNNLKQLSQNIITDLVKYVKANQGQLFVVNSNNDDEHLELVATYAWGKTKHVNRTIGKGDGLAGQAWIEKNTIYLKEIPKDYVKITSGLGEALPNCILIVPLQLNGEVFGLVEIGSFHPFETYEIEFIEKLAELVASTLSTAKVNERTRQLLEESQQQGEEMRAQEEEMRQNMEELTATQEEMARKDLEMSGQLMAINNSMATIEFTMNGNVVAANEKFLNAMGYRLDEIKGRHHRMFLDDAYASSDEYQKFWKDLNNGSSQTGEFKRRTKKGESVWISASYTVVMDKHHNPVKVIKFAMDITEQKLKSLDFEGQINAVNNTMASIEFNLDGKVVKANNHFLAAVGYSASEIVGQHHSMFIDSAEKESTSYISFWNELRAGKAQTGDFKRYGKNKKEIWINASYTPIKDATGKVYKIVKFAQDVTEVKLKAADFEGQINAINNTMASIEFNLDGKIMNANTIFLNTVRYGRDEVLGQHHSIFVDPLEVKSLAYAKFWENLREGKAQTGEFRRLNKNGNEIWINASYTPIKDPTGKVYKIVKFAQDITELKAIISRKSA